MMSLRTRFAAALSELRGNPLENPATSLSAPAQWLYDLFGAGASSAGVAVNEHTAMQLATVFTCIFVLSRDISTLPAVVYQRKGKKRSPAIGSPLYNLITKRPNPEMTAPTFWGAWYACAILTGNGYAEIQRDPSGAPIALWLLNPRVTKPRRDAQNNLVYEATVNGQSRTLDAADVLHLRGLSLDGWLGLSPIQAAKQTIGTAIAAEKYGAGFFGRGSRPSGILTGPEMKAGQGEKLDQARKSWEDANSGENQGRTAVMPNGWTWTAIGITPEEAQFLETQHYTRAQIAALFGLPPNKVGDTSRLSNSNHESQQLEYATNTLRPWTVNGEAEIDSKLLPRNGRNANQMEVEHDFSQLTRADYITTMNGLAIGRQWGAISGNEMREALQMDPRGKESDVLLVPLNMVSADSVLTGDDVDRTEGAESAGDGEGDLPDPSEEQPKGNGGRNQRQLLDRMSDAYGPLVADAMRRMAQRSKRDADAVAHIFGPVTEAIAGEAQRQAGQMFRLKADADLGVEKILRDYRKAVEKRSAEWSLDVLGREAMDAEVTRAVRAIVLPIFREAGGHIALAA